MSADYDQRRAVAHELIRSGTMSSGELRASIKAIASSEPGSVSKMIFRVEAEAACDSAATKAMERKAKIRSFLARQTLLLSFFSESPTALRIAP